MGSDLCPVDELQSNGIRSGRIWIAVQHRDLGAGETGERTPFEVGRGHDRRFRRGERDAAQADRCDDGKTQGEHDLLHGFSLLMKSSNLRHTKFASLTNYGA